MPKEQVNYPKWQEILQDNATIVARMSPVVQVGWTPASGPDEGAVQIAMTQLIDIPVSQLDADGKPRKWPTGDERITRLSRTDINKLIRTLRRARDQAFGQDE